MRRLARALLLLAVLAAIPAFLYARAGGGQSYSGGHDSNPYSGGASHSYSGSSSYYSSSNDGFLFDLIALYIQLMSLHPLVGLAFTIFVVYVLYMTTNVSYDRYKDRVITDGLAAQDHHEMAANLGALKTRDPLFDPTQFLARAQTAFTKVQNAWAAGDMTPARAFVSDGVMVRFTIQLEMNAADGIRNKVDQLRVLENEVLEVVSDQHFDAIHVRLRASAVDQDVDKDGAVVRNAAGSAEEFEEVWTFLRRPGAKTLGRPGLIEGCCPQCGSPLPALDAAQCDHCKAWVNTGDFDWVLCEITQACEWTARDPELEVPGLVAACQADVNLNVDFLEERASVAFWRWQQALSSRDAAPLVCMAPPSYLDTFAVQLAERAPYYRGCAIGGTQVLAVADDAVQWQHAHVLVKWSGIWFDWNGSRYEDKGQVERQHVFVLGRRLGAQTDRRHGFRSLRCPSCGAATWKRDQSSCDYCQALLNDGKLTWVVRNIIPIGMWKRPAIARQQAGSFDLDWVGALSPTDAVAVLASAMVADGEVSPEERRLIEEVAERRGVPLARMDDVVSAARRGQLDCPAPKTREEAEAILRGLIQMSLSDGRVADGERRALNAYGLKVGLTVDQVGEWIDHERQDAYKRARAALANGVRPRLDGASG